MSDARLSTLDLLIVAAYILGMTLIGAWFTRRQRDLKTYFVGDRNVSWWLVLVSIVATETSTVSFLSVPGFAFATPPEGKPGGNFTFLQLCLGYIVGRSAVAWFLLPQYFRGELFSAYQVLRQRFGPAVQRSASGLFLVTRTIADGLRLFLTALLLQQFAGIHFETALVIMGLATIAYTYLGGMQAVIWTDLIQFVIYVLGAVVALGFLIHLSPGGWGGLVSAGEQAGKFTLFDFRFEWTNAYTFWAGLVGGAVFTMASHGADQLMVQRYLCAQSLGAARFALVASGFTVLAQFALFLLIGVGLYVVLVVGAGSLAPDLRLPVGSKNDEVFGFFIVRFLPVGVVGLIVAAVLAAAMSTLSSSLNSSANALVTDFYRPLRPDYSEKHYLTASKVLTAGFGVAQVGVALGAYWLRSEQLIVEQVLAVAGLTTGLVLGLFVLGSLRRPVPSWAALIGLGIGALAVLCVFRPPAELLARLPDWVPGFFRRPILAWPWYAPVGAGTTVLVALAAAAFGTRHGPPADRSSQPGLDPAR